MQKVRPSPRGSPGSSPLKSVSASCLNLALQRIADTGPSLGAAITRPGSAGHSPPSSPTFPGPVLAFASVPPGSASCSGSSRASSLQSVVSGPEGGTSYLSAQSSVDSDTGASTTIRQVVPPQAPQKTAEPPLKITISTRVQGPRAVQVSSSGAASSTQTSSISVSSGFQAPPYNLGPMPSTPVLKVAVKSRRTVPEAVTRLGNLFYKDARRAAGFAARR